MIRTLLGTLGILLATAGVAQSSSWFSATEGTKVTALVKAHQAYAQRDYASMTKLVHEVMTDTGADRVEQKNALALLSKAFNENKGRLPADWSLPAPLTRLKFKHHRKELPDGIEFSWAMAVNGPERDTVTSIKLVKFPNQIILDRETGVGEWTVEPDEGAFYFEIYGGDVREPLPEGLYLFTITLKDGSKAEGWFPVERMTSSASPTLNVPEVGQTYDQGNPELHWEDFRSPEYQSSERRYMSIDVGRLDGPNSSWSGVWSHYETDPIMTSAVVGRTPDSEGVDKLVDGKYWLSLTYLEQRTFGDVRLRRGSRTARPFYVRTVP